MIQHFPLYLWPKCLLARLVRNKRKQMLAVRQSLIQRRRELVALQREGEGDRE